MDPTLPTYTVSQSDTQATLAFTWIAEPTPTIVRNLVQGIATVTTDDNATTLPMTGTVTCDIAQLDQVKRQLEPANFV